MSSLGFLFSLRVILCGLFFLKEPIMTLKNVLQLIRMRLGTDLKFAVIVFEFVLFFTLIIVAIIGGFTERLWMVLVVVLCFAVWVLYLLSQRKDLKSVITSLNTSFIRTNNELENYKSLRVRRADLLSCHVD